MNPLIIIPARLKAVRFPNKPLALIDGKPMILRVFEQAQKANIGTVVVACCSPEIQKIIEKAGGRAVITDPNLPSGTDRVHAAAQIVDPKGQFDVIVNLQGDLPAINPAFLADVVDAMGNHDMGTLVSPLTDPDDIASPAIVKAVFSPEGNRGQALYFTRGAAPYTGPYYYHIGVYSYTRQALDAFVNYPPSFLEQRENLEQLRMLENGRTIGVKVVDAVPQSVDLPDDINKVEAQLKRMAV